MINSLKRIKILPRMAVPYLKDVENKYVAVSFYEPSTVRPQYPSNAMDVLYFNVSDLDGGKDLHKKVSAEKNMRLFNENDAKLAVEFLNKYKSKADFLVCQCDAGVSRSAACAAAASKAWFNDDEWVFKGWHPNRWIYRLILEEFHK